MDQRNQSIFHGVQCSTQGSAPDDLATHGLASQNTSHNGLGHDRPQLVNLPDNDSPAENLMNNDTLTAASDAAVGGSVGGGGGSNSRRHGSHGGSRRETGHDASPRVLDKKYRSIAGNHHYSNGNSNSQDGAVTEGGKHVDSSASRSAAGSGRSCPSKQHLCGESGSGGSGSNTNSKSSRKRSRHGSSHQEHLNCKKSSTGATSTEGSENNGLPSSGNGATAGLGSAGPGTKMGELINSTTGRASAGDSLLMNMPLAPGIAGASNAGSIVSFGLNFNFDSTSSPSNSDSGDAGNKGGEGSSEEDGNGNTNQNLNAKSTVVAAQQDNNELGTSSLKITCRRSRPTLPGGSGSGTTSKGKLAAGKCGNGSSNNGESGCNSKNSREEGFDNSSDSSNNCDSGGSASGGSNSGNDGSSGGKSTISSLTTSSNQDWVTTSEAVAGNPSVGEEGCLNARNRAGERMNRDVETDGKTSSNKIDKVTSRTSGNKRKKFPGSDRNDTGNDEDSTGGYNTDEEQWGGNRNNIKDNHAVGPALAHKQHHHIGMSSPVSMPNASTAFKGPTIGGNGPPLKQARFNDQLAGMASMAPVPSAGESAQNGISSLSSGTAQPAATPTARTPLTSSDANAVTSSSNQNDLSPALASSNHSGKRSSGKHHAATMDQRKREERNAREKERSCRIARQIDDLRNLLSRGGVIVAKGTKSSVLAEAANYINMLQEQQCRWEMDRQALIQQVQQAGGVPNLNNQQQPNMLPPGVPQGVVPIDPIAQQQQEIQNSINSVSPYDYKYVFNNSSVGMAIASMGGAFVDCNEIFCQLSGYTREEVCSMTIFNMTSRDDLQHAFELISQMITPPTDNNKETPNSIVLRGAMKKRDDLGLSISLIKGEHGIVKCFCITLVKILSVRSQADTVAYEMELPRMGQHKQTNVGFGVSPAYTSG